MLRKIKVRIWDHTSASDYIATCLRRHGPFGLKYLSACDFLKISPAAAQVKL